MQYTLKVTVLPVDEKNDSFSLWAFPDEGDSYPLLICTVYSDRKDPEAGIRKALEG